MPVWKFRSFEDARRALWLEPGDPSIPQKLDFVLYMAGVSRDVPFARGVHRYRTAVEADGAREAWIDARVQRIRQRDSRGPGRPGSP
jgi:hypothetical protein